MTTVLADLRLGVMVADSAVNDGDRLWIGQRKVWRIGGDLLGFAGRMTEVEEFLLWWRSGCNMAAPAFSHSQALVMRPDELLYFSGSTRATPVQSGREAIGTGGKGAMCAYEALGWSDPRKAVGIACHHDLTSSGPVRVYKLKGTQCQRH